MFPLDFECVLDRNGKAVVTVKPSWEHQNLVRIGPYEGAVLMKFSPKVNILAAPVFSAFFNAVKAAGFTQDIKTYDGGYVARLKRGVTLPPAGSPKSDYEELLSNHSRGTAVDFNAAGNPMGQVPAAGSHSLHNIAAIARAVRVKQDDGTEWGIVWGGDWKNASCDPMHFEIGVWS